MNLSKILLIGVILNEGINRIRDLHYDDVSSGRVGVDGTAATASQTGLQSTNAASVQDIVKTKADKSMYIEYRLPSTIATGITVREFETINSTDSINYDRTVHTGVDHTANDDYVHNKIYYYDQPD